MTLKSHLKHKLICSVLGWFRYISLCSSLRRNSISETLCHCFSLRKNLWRIIIQGICSSHQKILHHHIAPKSCVLMYTLIASLLFRAVTMQQQLQTVAESSVWVITFPWEGGSNKLYSLFSMWEEEGHQIIRIKQPWPVPKLRAGGMQAGRCEAMIIVKKTNVHVMVLCYSY